jgi:hypothetical protein
MDPVDAAAMRADILRDVGELLRDELAGAEWGRVLVEVTSGQGGEVVVAGMDVEEIVGDEARVDAAFARPSRELLAAFAKATEALCAIEGVAVDDVRGGTFVRIDDRAYAFLPGLVHVPSVRFDGERDALVARLEEKNARLRERFPSDHVEVDVDGGSIAWVVQGRRTASARATAIGTFVRASRTWAWAWSHPSLPDPARRASAALTDAIEERDMWEIATPVFATDEATAWALAALVCDRAGGDGVQRIAREDGALFVLVREAPSPVLD